MFIIGFTGPAGCGKDTAAIALAIQLQFRRFALAGPIKNALSAMLQFHPEQWEDRNWKERSLPVIEQSPRYLAQTLGTEWGRNIDPDFWIKVTESLVDQDECDRVVISDIRFDNEARWIQSLGGWVIHIQRDDVSSVNNHVSEDGINPNLIDLTLYNNGTLSDFVNKVVFEAHSKLKTYYDEKSTV